MAPKTTIVLLNGFGNHSNRLFQTIYVEAFALEHGLRFYNPSFHNMAHLYHCESHFYDNLISAPAKLLDSFRRKFRINDRIVIHFDDPANNEANCDLMRARAGRAARYILVDGWTLRTTDLTLKYQDFFIRKYTIRENLLPQDGFFRHRSAEKKYVAVHIRRGDYRAFSGGKYFYDWEVYRQGMDSMRKEIRARFGLKSEFIIFSDEDAEALKADDVSISHNHWYVDHFLMSQCDYIIGPPSTFSHWASYIGKTPCYQLQNADDVQLRLDNFACCIG